MTAYVLGPYNAITEEVRWALECFRIEPALRPSVYETNLKGSRRSAN